MSRTGTATTTTRRQLTVATAVVVAAALTLAGAAALLALRHSLLAAVDADARDDARDVSVAYEHGHLGRTVVPPTPDAAIQVVNAAGQVVARSPAAPPDPLLSQPRATPARIVATGRLPIRGSADTYHVAIFRPAGAAYTVLVALPSDDVTDAVNGLRRVLLVGAPVLFALLVGLAFLVIGRALAPVERMQQRQREFVADAAHELRTPLAGVLAQLELMETGQSVRPAAVTPVRAELLRLDALVESLLALTRATDRSPAPADVDLDDIVRASVDRARHRAPIGVELTADVSRPVRMRGDAVAIGRAVDNLVDNAMRHARSAVRVGLALDRNSAVVTVSDDGPGIPAADRQRVFERFARLDSGRNRSSGGAGLGLAIVAAVVAAHGGSVEVTDNAPGARFVVRLPVPTG